MRPIYANFTIPSATNTVSAPVVLDQYIAPGNIVFTTILSTLTGVTSVTIGVEHTNDDVFARNYNPATGNWEPYLATPFPAPLTPTNTVAEGVYAFAPRAIRFTASAINATTFPITVSLQVIQAGVTGT